jgi:hypothetical protein
MPGLRLLVALQRPLPYVGNFMKPIPKRMKVLAHGEEN